MGLGAESYARMMQKLLPKGRLRLFGGALSKVLLACADELARVDARANDLLDEADPSTADELLPEHERELGVQQAATLDERRARVKARTIARQRYRPEDFQLALAPLLGQAKPDVSIIERTAAQAVAMGDAREALRFFVYRDPSIAGSYYPSAAQDLINAIKPAHTAGHMIESTAMVVDDAHSLCGRDLIGGESVAPETYWIFIIGQSNAGGKGLGSEMETAEPGVTTPFPAVKIYDQGAKLTNPPTWVTDGLKDLGLRIAAVDGVQFPANGGGVELTLGRELAARTPHTIYIAKFWIDGSSLDANWTEPTWPTGGPSLQDQFYAFVAARLASVPGSKIGAVVPINGESDSGAFPADTLMRENSHALIDPLRDLYPTHNFLVVQHRLSKRYGSPLIVRSGQESFAVDEGSLGAVTYGDDLPFSDFAHYTSESLLKLGRRIADAIIPHLMQRKRTGPRWMATGMPSEASGGAGLAPTVPSFAVGDLAFMVIAGIGTGAYAFPAGWTPLTTQHGGGVATRLQVAYKVLTGSDVAHAAQTIADISGDDAKTAMIFTVRGGVLGQVTGASSATAGTTISFPSVTTTGPRAMVIYIGAHDIDSGTDNQVTFTQPVGSGEQPIVQHIDISTANGSGSGFAVAAQMVDAAGVVPGPSATMASSSWAAMSISIEASP